MTLAAPVQSGLSVTDRVDGWHVEARRVDSYPIHFGDGLLSRLGELLAPVLDELQAPGVVLVADAGLPKTHLATAQKALSSVGVAVTTAQVPEGEASKSLEGMQRVWRDVHTAGTTRRTLVIALGGGMVCDLITTAVGIYMRGLAYALVPTTVLAQLDAAIGGKGGLDWDGTKNLLGVFHHPAAVVIDPEVTRTLSNRQVRNGLAEAIKVALIADPQLFSTLEQAAHDPRDGLHELDHARLSQVVRAAVAAKLDLVSPDPFERGDLRRMLNLGHCAGHPLEAATGYRMAHGEAVAAGTAAAAAIAVRTGNSDEHRRDRILTVLAAYGLPTTVPARWRDAVWQGMEVVRRIRNGPLHLVLPVEPGHCMIIDDLTRSVYDQALVDLDHRVAPR